MAKKVPLAKLQKALSSKDTFDALTKVRELIPDDGAGAQEVVVYGFACDLEVNSAGLSILLDRFEGDELLKIFSALQSIGATQTLTALRKLQKLPESKRVDGPTQAYVDEIEQKLLAFCKAHVEELAAG